VIADLQSRLVSGIERCGIGRGLTSLLRHSHSHYLLPQEASRQLLEVQAVEQQQQQHTQTQPAKPTAVDTAATATVPPT
jgi:hypothetical protein